MDNITDKKEIDCKSIVYSENRNESNRYEVDVPFVPTPVHIVNQMLSIANVNSSDTVYDLGCGDGRAVIAAAKDFNADAVGYDIDIHKIEESIANAKKAGVSEKVSFFNKNIFEAPITDATVVFLYLLTNINVRLRIKLLTELKPGSRVISHDFDMDSWLADNKSSIENHSIYSWIIPANFSGTWYWNMPEICGGDQCMLKIKQQFQNAEAFFRLSPNYHVENVSIKGNQIEIKCHVHLNGSEKFFTFNGTIKKNIIKGSIIQNGIHKQEWKATRNPLTIGPII